MNLISICEECGADLPMPMDGNFFNLFCLECINNQKNMEKLNCMINTPAFQSIERYNRLRTALERINSVEAIQCYDWMRNALHSAIKREEAFVKANAETWIKELYNDEEKDPSPP